MGSQPPDPAEAPVSPSNPRRPGTGASTSFRASEIEWLDQLLKTVLRGGDALFLVRSSVASNVIRKVNAMKRSLERQKESSE